jgi:hypothetical protein
VCGFNETGPKLLQAIFQAGALVIMFVAMRKLFGTLAAAMGVIIASAYLSAPLIAKFGNVKEQYMIAFMVIGVSCFVLYQLGGKWWWAVLAGGFLSWAPLFKETGTSAIGAVGLFVVLQPVLKNRTCRQAGLDILFLLAGAAVAIAPLYVWIIAWDVQMSLPYSFAWKIAGKMLFPAEDAAKVGAYVSQSREIVPFSKQWPRVLRYYGLLILPIALAAGSVGARIVRMLRGQLRKLQNVNKKGYERFVLLFTVWWLLDMAFVWISPRSYEQYYLPLNASAAMLGGYVMALYWDKVSSAVYNSKWVIVGVVGFVCMAIMSWHIFFGIEKSPHTGRNYGEKRRGYAQKLEEISRHKKNNLKYSWESVGDYIRRYSAPDDKIYVWGWVPGIYVKAQRLSCASRACVITRTAPQNMEKIVAELLAEFEQQPKFIVDTRKLHIPTNWPPLELWPRAPEGVMGMKKTDFLPLDKKVTDAYDRWWTQILRSRYDENEALQYEAMKPLREFVMSNYRVVGTFGRHVLFERK